MVPDIQEVVQRCIEADSLQIRYMKGVRDALVAGCDWKEVSEHIEVVIQHANDSVHRNMALLSALNN